jgi:uncharacterized protein
VAGRFDLRRHAAPFQRCIRCNGLTEPVDKAAVLDQLQPKTRHYYDAFWRCAAYGQIYWRGSHVSRMQALIERALGTTESIEQPTFGQRRV